MDNKDLNNMEIIFPINPLETIFALQRELMVDYQVIEKWDVDFPVNLNLKKSQLLVKDVIARAVEELAEAFEALELGDTANFLEELADALHFFTEVFILADITVEDYTQFLCSFYGDFSPGDPLITLEKSGYARTRNMGEGLKGLMFDIIYQVNLSRNALRNKPWKQTELMYNKEVFNSTLMEGYTLFLELFLWSHPKGEVGVYETYYKKNQINRFRIKSKY